MSGPPTQNILPAERARPPRVAGRGPAGLVKRQAFSPLGPVVPPPPAVLYPHPGMVQTRAFAVLTFLLSVGCGGGDAPFAMEPLRIQAHAGGETTAYDAQTLFAEALGHLNAGRCSEGVVLYDRLADEFPESQFRSPALYNAGFCLFEDGVLEEAALRFERLLREGGTDNDTRHAGFQLARLRFQQEAFSPLLQIAETLLAREDLSTDERAEALARKAQALLGTVALDAAEAAAREVLLFARTRPDDAPLYDNTFVAAAAFVLGETFRLRSEQIRVMPGALEVQREQLETRARWLLQAQRAYFDTIGHGHPQWSTAAGFRIGGMYDGFWQALMEAPPAPPDDPLSPEEYAIYEASYRERLQELAHPLLRHAVRYWELTLMMVERTRSRGPWSERIREGLDRVRGRLELSESRDSGG